MHTWAVVLAAGDGKRLSRLTANGRGGYLPKQFCTICGGPTLLQQAIARAKVVVPENRVCAIVARQHEHLWGPLAKGLPPGNLIVQPGNRGTGNGVLLAIAYILKRDPKARVIFLPADHHVLVEESLAVAMDAALKESTPTSTYMHLLGIEPEGPDVELGYIVPQDATGGRIRSVRHFVEKPSLAVARELIRQGGLWNSLIFAMDGQQLWNIFSEQFASNAAPIKLALAQAFDPGIPPRALSKPYEHLAELDFSRHILQHHVARLRVIAVPRCGWSDLGTPSRVSERVNLLGHRYRGSGESRMQSPFVDLADAVHMQRPSEGPPDLSPIAVTSKHFTFRKSKNDPGIAKKTAGTIVPASFLKTGMVTVSC